MIDAAEMNTQHIQNQIKNRIEEPREKTVDVKNLVDNLVEAVEKKVDDGSHEIDATWEVLEQEEPYAEMSHTERLYLITSLFTNYGVSPDWLTEDRRVTHAETWKDITFTFCEYGLYEVVYGFVSGEIKEDPHKVGEFMDSRRDAVRKDFTEEMRANPILNTDVHNWIASLASNVSTRLANYDEIPKEDRTDVQRSLTDAKAETENEAINDVIEEEARSELLTCNLIEEASFLDALEDLYLMDGSESIETEQLETAANTSWDETITTGVIWHAMAAAIEIHRETFSDEFKHRIDR